MKTIYKKILYFLCFWLTKLVMVLFKELIRVDNISTTPLAEVLKSAFTYVHEDAPVDEQIQSKNDFDKSLFEMGFDRASKEESFKNLSKLEFKELTRLD